LALDESPAPSRNPDAALVKHRQAVTDVANEIKIMPTITSEHCFLIGCKQLAGPFALPDSCRPSVHPAAAFGFGRSAMQSRANSA